MITLDIKNYAEQVANYKYAYAFIATDLTNTEKLAIGVDMFNDFDELAKERGMDKDEIVEMKELCGGEMMYNDNYWTIVRIK